MLCLLTLILVYTNKKGIETFEKPVSHPQKPTVNVPDSKKTLIIDSNKELSNNPLYSPSIQVIDHSSKQLNIYEPLSLDEARLTTKARHNINPVGAIRIHSNRLNNLRYNDPFMINDIEGNDYTMTVSNIQKHSDGSVTTTGIYHDEDIRYTATITHSDQESFITLSTPQGIYEIESSNHVGYIYRSDTMRRKMQDTTISDVIVLPIPKAPIEQ
jgi:hypothetical protein